MIGALFSAYQLVDAGVTLADGIYQGFTGKSLADSIADDDSCDNVAYDAISSHRVACGVSSDDFTCEEPQEVEPEEYEPPDEY